MQLKSVIPAVVVSALIVSGCETTSPAEDPVMIKLNDLDRRLAAIERVIDNGSLVALSQQVEGVQRDTATLLGRTETLAHDAESTAARQRDLYMDLDERIQQLESRAVRPTAAASVMDGGPLPPGELPVPGGSDRDNYQAAFELLKEQRYEPAAMAFQQFLVSFPDSELAENAQYWLAESYYVTDDFEEGLTQFERVINNYPRSRKVPDALLKMGYCNYELERWDESRAALQKVLEDHGEMTAARLAEQRLKRMDEEGV